MLTERLKLLAGYIDDLEEASHVGREEFLENKVLRRYVERTLHVAIEACLDIGGHIISSERFREPEDNKDIFAVLVEEGILARDKLPSLQNMAKFCNLLVHDYAKIDPTIIYTILQENCGDLRHFAATIVHQFREGKKHAHKLTAANPRGLFLPEHGKFCH